MIVHNLTQGSAEWLAYRSQHFNASDAPAMMGCSPYKTRSQLLHELHTGIVPEVDAATQRRFNEGHRIEAIARPLAEKVIGQDLFPVVGSLGELSASFDGLTMCETITWEHKTLNDELRKVMHDDTTPLPLHYRVQMEQQMMVSGAVRALFTASDWDGYTLIDIRHRWYESDPSLQSEIVRGWQQFAVDLAAYTAPDAPKVQPIGAAPQTLPALRIEVTGMVTASNLDAFKAHAVAVFDSINRNLQTDAHFADAEATVKWCAEVENRLAAAKQHALSQTASIDVLFGAIDDISAMSKRIRLDLDKLVKARKEAIRDEMLQQGASAFARHIDTLNHRIGSRLMPAVKANFSESIKGKRTVDSLRNAISTELARAKIAANEIADLISINLQTIAAHSGMGFLFADVGTLVLKDPSDMAAIVQNRIAGHHAEQAEKEQATRERIRVEEQARAERAARETKAAAEQAEKVAAEAAPVPVHMPVCMPAQTAVYETIPEPRKSAPALKLGDIAQRLGFTLNADFVAGLGFKPSATRGASKLYHEEDFALILAALVRHIQSIQQQAAA
jgi:putative phage-type endonuclease